MLHTPCNLIENSIKWPKIVKETQNYTNKHGARSPPASFARQHRKRDSLVVAIVFLNRATENISRVCENAGGRN